jgi:membrane dipeptidase
LVKNGARKDGKKMRKFPIFDGHNDTLQMFYLPKRKRDASFFEKSEMGHIDYPRAHEGGFSGGLFSIFVPSQMENHPRPGENLAGTQTSYELPMAPSVDLTRAQEITLKGTANLFRLETASDGRIKVVRTVDELEECLHRGILGVVLHFEGADAIDTDLDALYVFYNAGLRALGISWSRVNEFAHGVPYWFPHSPDIGPGLSAAGRELIHACNELGILIDVSHLNEHGFWDVETLSNAPLVASHSGVYALCPTTRNLTDKQLDAIKASNGVVGVNFHVAFLRTDGRLDENTPMMEIVRHIDYIVERIGIDHVAFGSDFDGATMPVELRDASGLPKLLLALHDRGYNEASLEKLTHKNWIRVFRNTWKK